MMPGNDCADEAAVKNEAAVLDHENFRNRLAGKLVIPVSRHIDGARAENRADHDPERDVGDGFAGNFFAPGAQRGRPQPKYEGQRDHHAIGMDRERTEMKQYRMHGGKLSCGGGNGELEICHFNCDS